MRRLITSIVLLMAAVLAIEAATAQQFDTSRPIALKGNIATIMLLQGEPSYLLVDVKDASGRTETWAVQGNPLAVLMQDGWTPRGAPLRLGDFVTVMAFPPRVNANVTAPFAVHDEKVLELVKAGRLLRGTEITLPNGTKVTFGAIN